MARRAGTARQPPLSLLFLDENGKITQKENCADVGDGGWKHRRLGAIMRFDDRGPIGERFSPSSETGTVVTTVQGGGGQSNTLLIERVRKSLQELQQRNSKIPSIDPILHALSEVDRALFVPLPHEMDVYGDRAMPIGYDATCSQPTIVALMAVLLQVKSESHVLSIGTGCGYSDAVTYQLLGSEGSLTSIELIPELAALARENLTRFYGGTLPKNIHLLEGNGSRGYVPNAPYDRIYLAARIQEKALIQIFLDQLAEGGILVCPEALAMPGYEYINPGELVSYHKENKIERRFHLHVGFVNLKV